MSPRTEEDSEPVHESKVDTFVEVEAAPPSSAGVPERTCQVDGCIEPLTDKYGQASCRKSGLLTQRSIYYLATNSGLCRVVDPFDDKCGCG